MYNWFLKSFGEWEGGSKDSFSLWTQASQNALWRQTGFAQWPIRNQKLYFLRSPAPLCSIPFFPTPFLSLSPFPSVPIPHSPS